MSGEALPSARVRMLAGFLLEPASATPAAASAAVAQQDAEDSARSRSPRRPVYDNGFHAGRTPHKSQQSPQKKTRQKKTPQKKDRPSAGAASAHVAKLDATTSRLKICHQINTLFRSQPSFASAEVLAAEFYAVATSTSQPTADTALPPRAAPPLPLLEAVLDALEESGELAHVPCEVLANLSLHAPFRRAMAVGEAAEIVLALLRATGLRDVVRRGGRQSQKQIDRGSGDGTTTNEDVGDVDGSAPKLLLACVAADLLADLVETDGSAAWFPPSLKERIVAQLNK